MQRRRPVRQETLQHAVILCAAILLPLLMAIGLLSLGGSPPPLLGAPHLEPPTPSDVSDTDVITIGVAALLSGPADTLGWPQVNAVQLAISQTNAAGGIEFDGTTYTLTLAVEDSGCNATQATTAAHALLDAGAIAVVGHTCSGATMAAQSVYNAAGVPLVSAVSSNPQVTKQGYTTTFRVIAKDQAQVRKLADYFRSPLGLDRVALVTWAASTAASNAFSETFTSKGGAVVPGEAELTDTADFTATIAALLTESPGAVFYADMDLAGDDAAARAGLLSSIAHNAGLTTFGWDAVDRTEVPVVYTQTARSAAAGDYVARYGRDLDDMPGYAGLNAAYKAANFANEGDEAGMIGAFSYDAAQVILNALRSVDARTPAALRDAIATMRNYQGVVGTYEGFDAYGDVIPQWAQLSRYVDGSWVSAQRYRAFVPIVLRGPR